MQIILEILAAAWHVFQQSAIYMLFGFFIAGILYAFVKTEKIARYLGKGDAQSVMLAALVGIPLPLCSCGVVPAAAALKKQGASKGATLSFLISTPETGVDSIPITYALLDPVMTVIRPISAFITASAAGIFENFYGKKEVSTSVDQKLPAAGSCCCHSRPEPETVLREKESFHDKMAAGLKYAFGELMGDIGPWFILGVFLASLISYLIPERFADAYLGNPFIAMPLMLIVGIPMYVCATSSTPIAAAFILKGLSPGAALVFLLAGPATNMASLSMVSKLMGKRSLVIYLGAISSCSLVLGFLTDLVYSKLGISARAVAGKAAEIFPVSVEFTAAIVLAGLIGYSVLKGFRKSEPCACSSAAT
ncbi:MAG: SO_0444 family Cu/Zn efflux transporter [Desulfobacterales bacterium]|nr:SO_0444 family Cu/Zn efflux transporter [Desulfobacterales bacterium]